MYKEINVLPINTNQLTEDQKTVAVDLSITMNQSANNLYRLLNIFNETTTTIGIYKLIYKLEEILITLNIFNTIDINTYEIREQSIGLKELLSFKEHSIRMFNNERSWITSYGSLGYYLGFITNKNASYLSPSEQSYYAALCLIKLYPNYKDLGQAIQSEDKQYDEFIYKYINTLTNRDPQIATLIRHLKSLYKYDLAKYGEPYLLANFKEGQHIDFLFQTISINYMYFLRDVYKAIKEGELLLEDIPLEETLIDLVETIYKYNEELIGPGGLNTLTVLLASSLIRRAHYLCNKDYVNNVDRIQQLIINAVSLLQFCPLTKDIGDQISQIITIEIEQYDNNI